MRTFCFFLIFCTQSVVFAQQKAPTAAKLSAAVEVFLKAFNAKFPLRGTVKCSKVSVDASQKTAAVYLNRTITYLPIREENLASIYRQLRTHLPADFKGYSLQIYGGKKRLEALIPNYYRKTQAPDSARLLLVPDKKSRQIVSNTSKPIPPITKGLLGRHLAIWHSHGWYYEADLARWEWQRARVFTTVEDLLPAAFVLPYLVPMLENAGASVFLPRERDWQRQEVIVDNDHQTDSGDYHEITLSDRNRWAKGEGKGFGIGKGFYDEGETPFALGSYRQVSTHTQETARARWTPHIPRTGEYAVYVAYQSLPNSTEKAYYTVRHSGGETVFGVNQQMGGGTWIFLGRFHFFEGKDAAQGSVSLSNYAAENGAMITADAVRFGGGMGNVRRKGNTSGYPRFAEAARYYLQYAGMPDTLVYRLNPDSDYKDDYQSRGEWVNFLKGAPFGPQKNRTARGLRIPIDLALGFHTDAGTTQNDTVVGTLMIHSTAADDGLFPDGVSRLASRDFADVLQTQIVNDLRSRYDSAWTRRGLWDKDYSEAYRPTVPAALLELLSHHNFRDMKFALDPAFRFTTSRAIYKGILRYLSHTYNKPAVVQPLPVRHFQTKIVGRHAIQLAWQPTPDALETTAKASGYLIYRAEGAQGFDNGTYSKTPHYTFENAEHGKIYRFKITALNEGGESFPSEILAACIQNPDKPTALIVNGFDRICAPAALDLPGFAGFAHFADEGVPDRFDLSFVGTQYDFNPASAWLDDDAPGHGASHANYETQLIAGNNFNFPFVHGKSLKNNGLNFVSAGNEALENGAITLSDYALIDWIGGEQRATAAPKYSSEIKFRLLSGAAQQQLKRYLQKGGNLFISGAYLGTDLAEGKSEKHPDVRFAKEILKLNWRTNHASQTNKVLAADAQFAGVGSLHFCNTFNDSVYRVEAPDAIEPAAPPAKTIFRYANGKSAGVAFAGKYGVVALGFPFETILEAEQRNRLMSDILRFFGL